MAAAGGVWLSLGTISAWGLYTGWIFTTPQALYYSDIEFLMTGLLYYITTTALPCSVLLGLVLFRTMFLVDTLRDRGIIPPIKTDNRGETET